MFKARKMIPVVATVIGLLLVTGVGCPPPFPEEPMVVPNDPWPAKEEPLPLPWLPEEPCWCLEWNPVTVSWAGSSPETWTGACGSIIQISSINSGTVVSIHSSINCNFFCLPSYSWSVTKSDGTAEEPWSGTGSTAKFTPTSPGGFTVVLNASCGSAHCPPCNIYIRINKTRACLYSGMDGMERLLPPTGWDIANPDAGSWAPINTIDPVAADTSAWGRRFDDLPWSFMYDSCANWVCGNVEWKSPNQTTPEYYRLPFTVPINGNCVEVHFQAYIDDSAEFYIDGPGYNGPTLFYTHPSDVSLGKDHDPAAFFIDADGVTGPDCLQPGAYAIYIRHRDAGGRIYGLIFTAECVPCQPCTCCECQWDPVTISWPGGIVYGVWCFSGCAYVTCGATSTVGPIALPLGTPINISFKVSCLPSPPCSGGGDKCTVTSPFGNTVPTYQQPSTSPWYKFSFTPTMFGSHDVKLEATCNGTPCECNFRIVIYDPFPSKK
jgi:hypothetical protein